MHVRLKTFLFLALILIANLAIAQNSQQGPTSLKYKLIEQFGNPFFCDKDLWPVARPEEPRAQEWFQTVDPNSDEFKTMGAHLGLTQPVDHLQADDILKLYQEHKKLQAIVVEGTGSVYTFQIRTGDVGKQGEVISGTISSAGEVVIQKRETVWNTCPKCLALGTRIDTPKGEVAVQDLHPGMSVWTMNEAGEKIAAIVQLVNRVPVPPNHQVVRLKLEDGRVLMVSPEHPLPDGSAIGDLPVGTELAGSRILSAERVPYNADFTYDLLPSGPTGAYWAEGILLGSTLSR